MKNKKVSFLIILLIFIMLCIGVVPPIHNIVTERITFETYSMINGLIFYLIIEIVLFNKHFNDFNESLKFGMREVFLERYKKEKKYKKKVVSYYRNIPFDGDLFKTFWVAYQYGIVKNANSIINALLLKWCLEGRIKFLNNSYQIIQQEKYFDSDMEEYLFNNLKNDNDRLIRLTSFNSKFIFKKVNDILLMETSKMRDENKVFNIDRNPVISEEVNNDADIVLGFKNFLLNFGNIEDKNPKEIILWKEYLIFAELLGIAKEVRKTFSMNNVEYVSMELNIKKTYFSLSSFLFVGGIFNLLLLGITYFMFFCLIIIAYINLTWYY